MSNTTTMEASASISTPANFPVTWPQPDDAGLFWSLDRMHWPRPVTPMTGQYIDYLFHGFNLAAQAYELPIRVDSRCLNSYHYDAVTPLPLSDEETAAQSQRADKKLEEAMQHLAENWEQQYLPEIKRCLAYWEDFNLGDAPLPALLVHLDETIVRLKRVWEIHFLAYFPFVLAPSLFEELYRDLYADDQASSSTPAQAFDAYRLLQGFDNKTLESDRALWQLSRQIRAMPQVRQVLEEHNAVEILARLEHSTEGRAFLTELQAYLKEYGQRGSKINELDDPSWIEAPAPVISTLQEYTTQPDRDLTAELVAQTREREQLVAEARRRLQGYPQPVVDRFEFLLKAAQTGTFVGEEHSFWIDQRVTYRVRQVVLEFGRRLAEAGVLDQREDVFYLTFDELQETAASLPRLDRRRLVAGRRAELDYFSGIQPPPVLGTQPPEPPPADPLSRAIGKFFGEPLQAAPEPDVLRGHAGSPGLAQGPARVISSLAEAARLQQGDILVAETTAPPWTPLFATAAAVITDTGGVLSHCAVVAREYRIPAVVGLSSATELIHDGQMLEVDGNQGLVRIVASG